MLKATCPICGRRLEGPIAEWPQFPFCCQKCKMIDLGRWLDGSYVDSIPVEEPDEGYLPEEPDPS